MQFDFGHSIDAGVTHSACATEEAEAALALGRLDGTLSQSLPSARRIFANMAVRAALVSALTQEGYAFTDQRFDAWFAGVVPLVDASEQLPGCQHTIPARILADTVLTELGYSSWAPLADAALTLRKTLLASRDFADGYAAKEALLCISDARALVAELGTEVTSLPFTSLHRLHDSIARSTRFAPAERAPEMITMGTSATGIIEFAVERRPPPSPRWAIELVYGEHLHATGLLTAALPCPGLVRLDALSDAFGNRAESSAARIICARALTDVAVELVVKLRRASESATRIAERLADLRRSSRSPALAEIITGFGAMRSQQIEAAFGITRLGVRGMLATLKEAGLVSRTSVSGVWLTGSARSDFTPPLRVDPIESSAFSDTALAEYDAANADLDRLLSRMNIEPSPDAD